jgi:arylsulfatase A-like enzyme
VPLLVRWPGVAKPGLVRTDPASSLDMNATSLFAAGIPIPEVYHGRPLFGPQARPRDNVFTARDYCDMTEDRIRCVRDARYSYIRNLLPDRPYTQFNQYIQNEYPTLAVMKELHAAGKLNPTQALFLAPRKPDVEFYDLQADPHEVNNLAAHPQHRKTVARYAGMLDKWLREVDRTTPSAPAP